MESIPPRPTTDGAAESGRADMSFLDHLGELRRRLIVSIAALCVGVFVGFCCYHHAISLFIDPFNEQMYITQIEQGFTTKIKISVYLGIILTFPLHMYNMVLFIIPALTRRERGILISFLAGSFLLLGGGGYIAYFQILPLSISFLKSTAFVPDNVTLWLNFRESLMFVFQLVLSFLALFQIPLVLLVLMMLNVIKRRWLLHSARYFIIVIFLVSAIITPPDIVSQIGLALPLILLFFVTILIAKVFNLGETSD